MALTRRRTLVRSAAVAAVTGSALLLPAAAAFADSPQPTGRSSENSAEKSTEKSTEKPSTEKPSEELIGTQRLSGGFTAKIYKVGPHHFRADMFAKDPATGKLVAMDTLETKDGKPARGQHNGAHFVLRSDGSMTSWVQDGDKKNDKKSDKKNGEKEKGGKENGKREEGKKHAQQGGRQTQVTPKGGVKAGAEGVSEAPDTPAVLLAGGGAAAAAGGLGFALLHRRKSGEGA
ncbi:hypothetical protein A6A06_02020 [Streptomyces sp. CB02923]|uniref:hypothetical protein n=1 Tax=Streptomyces sp. CB02923 TaxID=1718985 RepID=UPI00093907AA|nr:hypothetical protein [Streptomyces sp. CB02923]OKI09493.1 hypothetical protein A6A06_02020 [Streptomyces sp. CB02923]